MMNFLNTLEDRYKNETFIHVDKMNIPKLSDVQNTNKD